MADGGQAFGRCHAVGCHGDRYPVDAHQRCFQTVTHHTHRRSQTSTLVKHHAGSRTQAHDAGHVVGARPPAPFLSTAAQSWCQGHPGSHRQRTDALGSTDLVTAERNQRHPGSHRCHIAPGGGLHRIGVHHGVGRMTGHHVGNVGQRLDGAHLVVGHHHRHHGDLGAVTTTSGCGSGVEHGDQRLTVHHAASINGHGHAAAMHHRVQHGVVFDGAAHRCAPHGVEHAVDCQVVSLGASGGEHHLAARTAQQLSHRFACLVHGPTSGAAAGVGTGGISPLPGQPRQHGLNHLGARRGGSGMVHIGLRGWNTDGHPHRLRPQRPCGDKPAPRWG